MAAVAPWSRRFRNLADDNFGGFEMKAYVYLFVCIIAFAAEVRAQSSGNVVYSEANRAETNRRVAKGSIAFGAISLPDNSGMIIPAHVQINVKADEYVAVFGLSQDGRTVQECAQKIITQIDNFTGELKNMGAKADDVQVDHTTLTRTYDYQVAGNVANEKAVGFSVKKTIFVHFKEKEWMNRLMAAAAKSDIYDLIKVDYVVNNAADVREKLFEESMRIIREKAGRYDKLLGLKFRSQLQIVQENYNTIFPAESYDSYTAFEGGKAHISLFNDKTRVKEARKSETFFFNAQDPGNFDYIINPIVTEPVVQFSLYLQIRYLFDR
jgi:uncharacterized protein YggE